MLEKFEEYLGQLPLTKAIRRRIEEVITLNMKIKELDIQDIFICELKNEEGSRTYTSLWLFTQDYSIECKNFLTENDFDIVPHMKRVGYCSIAPLNFDFEETNENSSIKVHFSYSIKSGMAGISGDLIATEQNCIHAFHIYKKYVISNLID